MNGLAAAAAMLLAANSWQADLKVRLKSAPNDVEAFVVRRAGCNHFLGEFPFNEERAAFLERAIRRLRCDTLDREEQQLRRVHGGNPAILQLLDDAADLGPW